MSLFRIPLDIHARVSRRFAISQRKAGPENRFSSYPLISGDSFRCVADVIVDSPEDVPAALESLDRLTGSRVVLFSSAPAVTSLLDELVRIDTSQTILLIHNGDNVPTSQILRRSENFHRTYCVNWLAGGNILPLPIGIENAWLRPRDRWENNTVLPMQVSLAQEISKRKNIALVAFNDLTNPSVRTHARASFRKLTGNVECNRLLTARQYRKIVSDSFFVVSPPGNGPDCHRTWEAMYLGAVPIVLKSAWPFSEIDLPVLCVPSWEAAITQLSKNPISLYNKISSRAANESMLQHYWNHMVTN